MLYHLLPDTTQTNQDPRQTPRPHVDGIVGSTNVKSTDSATKSPRGTTSSGSSKPTQLANGHSVQLSKNPNGDQKSDGNKRKGQNNHKGGKNNNNKPKDKYNNGKQNDNFGEGRKEKHKVKFPCKLCTDDHLTHLCAKLVEAMRLLNLLPVVLTNPFPQNQHLALISKSTENALGGSQNLPSQDGDHVCINMVNVKIDISTHSRDSISSKASTNLEAPPPPSETNLQIEKPEPPPRIPKGVLKFSTHNRNARVTQNYSIV